MIPSRVLSYSDASPNASMSYRLCCGTLSHSDLSLSVGEQPRPLSLPTGASKPYSVDDQPSPPVENIAEICQHPIDTVDDTSVEGAYKFEFKNSDLSVRSKKTVPTVRRKGDKHKDTVRKSSKFWTKFRKLGTKSSTEIPAKESIQDTGHCECTGYRKTEDHILSQGVTFNANSLRRSVHRSAANASPLPSSASRLRLSMGAGPGPSALARAGDLLQMVPAPPSHRQGASVLDLPRFNPDDFPTEDLDEMRIAQRARDIEMGVEISPRHIVYPHLLYGGGSPPSNSSTSPTSSCHSSLSDPTWNLAPNFQAQCVVTSVTFAHVEPAAMIQTSVVMSSAPAAAAAAAISTPSVAGPSVSNTESTYSEYGTATSTTTVPVLPAILPPPPPTMCASQAYIPQTVHTQIDYIHCLVPDLHKIASCGFYWGVMDRYEAERLLENRPEGTFLLRDSAQEEFLFSVSFRRYDRSLHARIEQWNHKFSFDSHDPGVYAAESVTSLIEHYKDPSCCMFFEPLLTIPLNRTFPFSLQHLCRSVICAHSTYDGLNYLPLPKGVREYLKYYHYKQKVRVRRFEMNH